MSIQEPAAAHAAHADRFATKHLPTPRTQWSPANAEEARTLLTAREDVAPLLILGAGHHARPELLGERVFDVLDTSQLTRVLEVDTVSGLVRAEAGITWGALQARVANEGWTLGRTSLMPRTATLGGLLARAWDVPKRLFSGDLRDQCVALSAVTPAHTDYRYLAAPRKASGPDMRYMHIGGEGALGLILEATLIVWPQTEARLYSVGAPTLEAANIIWRWFEAQGARISWSWWAQSEQTLRVAVHQPRSVLARLDALAREAWVDELVLGMSAACDELRASIERAHPERRDAPHAAHTLALVSSTAALPHGLLAAATEIIACDWSQHMVRLLARFDDPDAALDHPEVAGLLHARKLLGGAPARWPTWAQDLKAQLDPHGALAIGP